MLEVSALSFYKDCMKVGCGNGGGHEKQETGEGSK